MASQQSSSLHKQINIFRPSLVTMRRSATLKNSQATTPRSNYDPLSKDSGTVNIGTGCTNSPRNHDKQKTSERMGSSGSLQRGRLNLAIGKKSSSEVDQLGSLMPKSAKVSQKAL